MMAFRLRVERHDWVLGAMTALIPGALLQAPSRIGISVSVKHGRTKGPADRAAQSTSSSALIPSFSTRRSEYILPRQPT